MKHVVVAAALGAFAASSAAAQEAVVAPDWSFIVSAYAWTPAISSTLRTERFGSVTNEMSIGDVLSDLDIAFMGAVEARRGRWSLAGDLVYSQLTSDGATPGRLFEKATLGTTMTALTGYAMYEFTEPTAPARFDFGVGFRAFWVDLDLDLKGDLARDQNLSTSENWIDPLVAARLIVPFNEKWYGTAIADLGGTGTDDRTWQALATVGYRLNDAWSLRAAYRYMRFDHEIGGTDTTMEMYGPVIGASYRF